MMIERTNNGDRQNENRAFLSFFDYAEDDTRLFFSNTNYNALVIVDKATGTIERIISFEGEGLTTQNMHLRCVRKENKICFLPARSQYIHIYDMENEKQYICDLPDITLSMEPYGFWDYFVHNEQIYLLPGCAKLGMWKWNTRENTIQKEYWWNISSVNDILLYGSVDEECFYSLAVETNKLDITNISNKLTESFFLPDEKITYITYDGTNFWYTLNDNLDIVCWNEEQGELDRYRIPGGTHWKDEYMSYFGIFYAAENLFLFLTNLQTMYVCMLDRGARELKYIHTIECNRGYFAENELEPHFKIVGNKLICLLKNAGELVCINLETLETEQYEEKMIFDVTKRDYEYDVLFSRGALLYEESGDIDLNTLIQYCIGN